jgi:hypothetical protein
MPKAKHYSGRVINRAGGIRTHTGFRPEDFKSPASTIPPPPPDKADTGTGSTSGCPRVRHIQRDKEEATAGFEPAMRVLQTLALPLGDVALRSSGGVSLRRRYLSGRWDSNPRPSPWQGDVLPLNYTRIDAIFCPATSLNSMGATLIKGR